MRWLFLVFGFGVLARSLCFCRGDNGARRRFTLLLFSLDATRNSIFSSFTDEAFYCKYLFCEATRRVAFWAVIKTCLI